MINKHLDLNVVVDNGCITVHIYEPETGETTTFSKDYSPNEHPEFDAELGKELYSWINLRLEEKEQSDIVEAQERGWSTEMTNMVNVTVYCDTTGFFNEQECEEENLCEIAFPREILKEYYKLEEKKYIEEQMETLGCSVAECSMDKWLYHVCTADDTQELCYFARTCGFIPLRPEIRFGSFPQAANGAEEPIEWKVLERKGNSVLLLSKKGLCMQQYSKTPGPCSWASSWVRNWLNDRFLTTAFSDSEKAAIQYKCQRALNNNIYDTPSGIDTYDRVFLLNTAEMEYYIKVYDFDEDEKRRCKLTPFARGASTYEYGAWWLRGPGFTTMYAAYVDELGSLTKMGYLCTEPLFVRPAIWVDLELAMKSK